MTSTITRGIIIRTTLGHEDEPDERREWTPGNDLSAKLRALFAHHAPSTNVIISLIESGLCTSVALAATIVDELYSAMQHGTFTQILQELVSANTSGSGIELAVNRDTLETNQILSEIEAPGANSAFGTGNSISTTFFNQFKS